MSRSAERKVGTAGRTCGAARENSAVNDQFMQDWDQIKSFAGVFPPAAFLFVLEGLGHTVRMIHGEQVAVSADSEEQNESHHVTGQQLCMGLRDYALRRYGRLAGSVLRRWNIRETDDFGRIVFALIDAQKLRKRPEDTLDDFRGVFDFDEAFGDLVPA